MTTEDRTHVTSYVDAVVVGAGFAGVYATYKMKSIGLSVRGIEAAPEPGGTWYWNQYPAARCDVESMDYSYGFSDEIQQNWDWQHRFSFQPDIQKYISHVAAKTGVDQLISFNTRVMSQEYDSNRLVWHVKTDRDETIECRYCIMATGNLTIPNFPDIAGLESFKGELYHSARWPAEGVDFTGKRVAVFGTGASGVQIIPEVAKEAEHVYVMQRTANYSVPARNRKISEAELAEKRQDYAGKRESAKDHLFGLSFIPEPTRSVMDMTEEQSYEEFEKLWAIGGSITMQMAFNDFMKDRTANQRLSDFVRMKIMETVDDAETARQLCPTDHPIGSRRICVDTDYYETFNRSNTELVNLRKTPVERITPTAISTSEDDIEVDAIIFATGFDAITGALTNIQIIGRSGRTLASEWEDGPSAYLGYMVHGFPNLFTITGPGSPSVKSNMVHSIEHHVRLIADTILYSEKEGFDAIEVDEDTEEKWMKHVSEVADKTLYVEADSWYTGANIPGKANKFSIYVGGVGQFRRACESMKESGYAGLTKTRREVKAAHIELDHSVPRL